MRYNIDDFNNIQTQQQSMAFMERIGWIDCKRISANEFSLEWNLGLRGYCMRLSPNFGLEWGTFSNCSLQIFFEFYSDYLISLTVYLLVPDEVVNNRPKITFSARLFNNFGAQLISSKSETWLTVERSMKILKLGHIDQNKRYIVAFDLKLFEETACIERINYAENVDFFRKGSPKNSNHLKNPTDEFCKEVKVERDSKTNTVTADEKVSDAFSVECPEYLINDLRSLYNTGLMSDFTIRVGEQTLHAHKLILCARSPVFQKMMEHEYVESTSNRINITDCEPIVFQKFLKYLYTGEIADKTVDTVTELYTLADKYDVKGLRISCSKILQSEFSSASTDHLAGIVANILQLAECHSDSKLKDIAMSFIIDHFPEVTNKQSWKEFLKSNSELTSEVLAQMATALRKTMNLCA